MAGKRRSIHVEGVHHGAPIPMGALVGNVLFSSGIIGIDPATGTPPDDLESQCEFAFQNMQALVENAGGTIEDIGSVKVWMKDRSQRDAVNKPWLKLFPTKTTVRPVTPSNTTPSHRGCRYNWRL